MCECCGPVIFTLNRMKIGGFPVSTENLGAAAMGVRVCGIIVGLIGVFWTWVNGGDFPRFDWWQFVLTPFKTRKPGANEKAFPFST